ncbi:hypothetical protein VTN77DRAFT_7288 [Rasamsonia byssochlamydoides]|uniref:uncharacterized protein n=1 Tax=Rasamsonia byssochlamydoides TaxID=89139 RepID=UPI0037440D90
MSPPRVPSEVRTGTLRSISRQGYDLDLGAYQSRGLRGQAPKLLRFDGPVHDIPRPVLRTLDSPDLVLRAVRATVMLHVKSQERAQALESEASFDRALPRWLKVGCHMSRSLQMNVQAPTLHASRLLALW